MGLKKKSKVSAEFSMSSLTDIIFLLLIFFMLTSSMVVPNALNLKLPGKKSSVKINTPPPTIDIRSDGTYRLNGAKASRAQLAKAVKAEKNKNGAKATIRIKPSPEAGNQYVVYVMDLAYRFNIQAVMD